MTVVGWNDNMAVYIASSKSSKPKIFICSALKKSWKKVYSTTITKLIPLLHPEHRFCRQNGPGRGHQAQDWYLNEKMVTVPVLANGVCCYSEVLEYLLFLAFRRDVNNAIFLKYPKEGRSFSSHVEIRNVPSGFRYRCYLKNKASVRCAKRTPDAVA